MTRRGFWGRYLRAYDALNRDAGYGAYLDDVASRLCTGRNEYILDAGSGTGNLSVRMKDLGARVVAVDFSPVAVAKHKKKDPAATVLCRSLEEPLPFADDTFDGIACTSVLFALSESGAHSVLREFDRVLKPGGKLIVTVARREMSVLRYAGSYVASRYKVQGLTAFLAEMIRALGAILRLLYYCFSIRRLKRRGGWRRFSEHELLSAVTQAGLTPGRCESTFQGKFNLLEATARPASARTTASTGEDACVEPAAVLG